MKNCSIGSKLPFEEGNVERMNDDYLITYSPLKALLLFSLPMMAGSLFQQLYTAADSIIVGRFVGESALAAVGASMALTTVFISIAIGGGAGATVITSKAFGAKDYGALGLSISTGLISFLILSVILALAGYVFSPWILNLLNTPLDIMDDANAYLRIYFLGLPFLFMYNILSSVFNSLGYSRIPLYLLIFSSLLNVVLDLVAVINLGLGVRGAAWATLISQAISAFLSFLILFSKLRKLGVRFERLFSPSIFSEMAGLAIPSILQQSTVSIGMMLVQGVVNTFGSNVLAGYSAAIRIDNIVTVPFAAVMNSMSSYTAQNIGAGKKGRVRAGYRAGLVTIFAFGFLIFLILEVFSHEVIGLFLGTAGTEDAFRTGEDYLRFLGFFYWILGAAMTTGGLLRGNGDMKLFTLASLLNLAFRVIASALLAPVYGVKTVWQVVPVGWFIYFAICYYEYRKQIKRFS